MNTLNDLTRAATVLCARRDRVRVDEVLACVLAGYEMALAGDAPKRDVAYCLTGLMAVSTEGDARLARRLREALELLGELELPSRHRSADASWRRLGSLLASLSDGSDQRLST
jgi:hypothetical protein